MKETTPADKPAEEAAIPAARSEEAAIPAARSEGTDLYARELEFDRWLDEALRAIEIRESVTPDRVDVALESNATEPAGDSVRAELPWSNQEHGIAEEEPFDALEQTHSRYLPAPEALFLRADQMVPDMLPWRPDGTEGNLRLPDDPYDRNPFTSTCVDEEAAPTAAQELGLPPVEEAPVDPWIAWLAKPSHAPTTVEEAPDASWVAWVEGMSA